MSPAWKADLVVGLLRRASRAPLERTRPAEVGDAEGHQADPLLHQPAASTRTVRDGLGPQALGEPDAGRAQLGWVDAGLDAQSVQLPQQVLGGRLPVRSA
jgi:hypothetical protein